MIYLDNAATTKMSQAALEALYQVSANQYGNPSSIYSTGKKAKAIIEESRCIIAKCIGAEPDEIVFTSGGTESDNWVINQGGEKNNYLITSKIEHHAILHPAENLRSKGNKVCYLNADSNCIVHPESLKKLLNGQPALVSMMMQNNETGVLQDIKKLAELTHLDNEQSIFHTDAVQAIGHIQINVKDLGVDLLSASAHKFNGPKGIGFLYIKKDCSLRPFILGGGQEKGNRSGTENVAGIYSMAKALEDNIRNLEEIHASINEMDQLFIDEMNKKSIPFRINGNPERRAAGIFNVSIPGIDGEGLLHMLDMHDICVSTGSACNSESQERSHVLVAMGLSDEQIDSSIRISIGRYNTKEDIISLVDWIDKIYKISLPK